MVLYHGSLNVFKLLAMSPALLSSSEKNESSLSFCSKKYKKNLNN